MPTGQRVALTNLEVTVLAPPTRTVWCGMGHGEEDQLLVTMDSVGERTCRTQLVHNIHVRNTSNVLSQTNLLKWVVQNGLAINLDDLGHSSGQVQPPRDGHLQ